MSERQKRMLCDAHEIAELLGVSESTVRSAARTGEIPCYRIKSLVRFDYDEVMEVMAHPKESPLDSILSILDH